MDPVQVLNKKRQNPPTDSTIRTEQNALHSSKGTEDGKMCNQRMSEYFGFRSYGKLLVWAKKWVAGTIQPSTFDNLLMETIG